MPTRLHVIKTTAQAENRLRKTVEAMADEVGIDSPHFANRRQFKTPEEARMHLMVTLADFLETYADAKQKRTNDDTANYESMTVDALTELAAERGILEGLDGSGSNGNIVKQDLIDALVEFDDMQKTKERDVETETIELKDGVTMEVEVDDGGVSG